MDEPQSIAGKKILYFAGTEDILFKAGGKSYLVNSIWPKAMMVYDLNISRWYHDVFYLLILQEELPWRWPT